MNANLSRVLFVVAIAGGCGATKSDDPSDPSDPGDPGDPGGPSSCDSTAGCFSLDNKGFFDDGTRLWSAASGPMLTGTINANGGQLRALVAGAQVGPSATVGDGTWSLALPAGTLSGDDTPVTLALDGGGKIVQDFGLDDTPPMIHMLPSLVRDELADTIDFSDVNAGPVHTHVGAAIDLTVGCPVVHEYAYLMDSKPGVFGRETTPNPIAWQFALDDHAFVDPSTGQFRVINDTGTALADWAPLAAPNAGVYSVALHRDAIPSLGTTAGKVHVQVQFADFAGRPAMTDLCVDMRPLAAPLVVGIPQASNDASSLFPWSLPGDSPISRLMNATAVMPEILESHVTQMTSEPIVLDLAFSPGNVTYEKDVFGDVLTSTVPVQIDCGDTCAGTKDGCVPDFPNQPACEAVPTVFNPPDPSSSGAITSGRWKLIVLDPTTRLLVPICSAVSATELACTIPPRAAGEAPRTYAIVAMLDSVTELRPSPTGTIGEFQLPGSVVYTGLPFTSKAGCSAYTTRATLPTGEIPHVCTAEQTLTTFVALKHINLELTDSTFHVKTTPAPTTPLVDAPYLAHGEVFQTILQWDSGIDNLP